MGTENFFSLENQVAIVTGAARGIGEGIARRGHIVNPQAAGPLLDAPELGHERPFQAAFGRRQDGLLACSFGRSRR